ncbi:MAG: cation diffusion facilitator family transporter [Verrucomicrobiota bacterium JB022]|nr:cation diffusion facilitator family transporter [Verrucomicrobiota bacterium JB022]
MRPREPYRLPGAAQRKSRQIVWLEWATVVVMLGVVAVMYVAMGSSQAMKTAWIEDLLALVPPAAFLIANHFRDRAPTNRFPYGFQRTALLSFLVSAVAILGMGLYMLYDAASSLIAREHPTLGHFDRFGWQIWSGWVMLGALVVSVIPPMILGFLKQRICCRLNERTILADATMNKDDWQTGVAAMLGVIGIGAGLWWADAVAAALISLNVIHDGTTHLRHAVLNLLDQRPTEADSSHPLQIDRDIRRRVLECAGVAEAEVRLREEGRCITGEIFVRMKRPAATPEELRMIRDAAEGVNDRLYSLVVMPVSEIKEA